MWRNLSSAIGRAITGRPVTLCAVAYARDWRRFVAAMDAVAWRLWRETDHCRAQWHREHD